MSETPVELAIVGSSLRGMARARRAQRNDESVAIYERAASPGGSDRSQRSEGFCCELGRFAFAADEWIQLAIALHRPPPPVLPTAEARTGWLWNGSTLTPTAVDGEPCSGATGCEDFAVAYRRELGPALHLGHEVAHLDLAAAGPFTLTFAGEPVRTATAGRLVLATGLAAASRLAAAFDPALGDAARRLQSSPRAFVFLGTWDDDAARSAWRGYGVLCETPDPARELLFCSNVFPRRAPAGKALVRVELGGPELAADLDDAALIALAEARLRAITGFDGQIVFARVHRAPELRRDGAYTECRVRLANVVARVPGLEWLC